MKKINYPGVDATGMDRKTFEKILEECEKESRTKSSDCLRVYIEGYELSIGGFGKLLRRMLPNYEPLKIRVFRNELTGRIGKETEIYGNS